MKLRLILQLARPRHWVKNIIVLFPVVFAVRVLDWRTWVQAALAAAAFCLASSAGYIFNDICDRERDRKHPDKKDRPLAAGLVSVSAAAVQCVVLAVAAAAVAWAVKPAVLVVVLAYVLLQLAYSLGLKHHPLLDVTCIAVGFVLRAVAGAVAISVAPSYWLIICTFTLCLFMGFCKRYSEVVTMGGAPEADGHRPTLLHYTPELLTHLITVSAAVAVVSFLLYASSDRTVRHFGTHYLIYTAPVVIYAVFRFAMLSMKGVYSGPTDLILHDRPFQIAAAIWLAAVLVVILKGPYLQELAQTCLQG
ncbi:MAG: decaprenyl-phosphate phosphoribosyltransferase [Phycisphaerae bacterium]